MHLLEGLVDALEGLVLLADRVRDNVIGLGELVDGLGPAGNAGVAQPNVVVFAIRKERDIKKEMTYWSCVRSMPTRWSMSPCCLMQASRAAS